METSDNLTVPDFALVESILWESCCGFWLLPGHLARLKASAGQFSFQYDEANILTQLDDVVKHLRCDSIVRVELHKDGVLNMMARPANADRRPVRATPAKYPIDPDNRLLHHSTTRREHYAQAVAGIDGVDEVLIWNKRGEVTGSCTSNLVFEINGEYYTPPLESGALPGVYRASLIQEGRLTERPIRIDQLQTCTRLYLINSLIGWREVLLEVPADRNKET